MTFSTTDLFQENLTQDAKRRRFKSHTIEKPLKIRWVINKLLTTDVLKGNRLQNPTEGKLVEGKIKKIKNVSFKFH